MKISKLETFPICVACKHNEVSAIINRGGVSDVVVKITADNGLVGWGEWWCRSGCRYFLQRDAAA